MRLLMPVGHAAARVGTRRQRKSSTLASAPIKTRALRVCLADAESGTGTGTRDDNHLAYKRTHGAPLSLAMDLILTARPLNSSIRNAGAQ